MSNWVETEMGAGQLQDARHAKRLAYLLGRLSEKPVHSIPSACHGWAETVAAYRFLDNPAVGEQEILSGHQHATLERIRTQDVVLLVQDTTFLDYGTTRPKKGMGTVKVKVREAYLLHPTVAFTPERMHLGGLGAEDVAAAGATGGHRSATANPLKSKRGTGGWKGISWRARSSRAVQIRSS